jgi:hypothetical protein
VQNGDLLCASMSRATKALCTYTAASVTGCLPCTHAPSVFRRVPPHPIPCCRFTLSEARQVMSAEQYSRVRPCSVMIRLPRVAGCRGVPGHGVFRQRLRRAHCSGKSLLGCSDNRPVVFTQCLRTCGKLKGIDGHSGTVPSPMVSATLGATVLCMLAGTAVARPRMTTSTL